MREAHEQGVPIDQLLAAFWSMRAVLPAAGSAIGWTKIGGHAFNNHRSARRLSRQGWIPFGASLSLVDHDPELSVPRRRAPLAFFFAWLFALNGLPI